MAMEHYGQSSTFDTMLKIGNYVSKVPCIASTIKCLLLSVSDGMLASGSFMQMTFLSLVRLRRYAARTVATGYGDEPTSFLNSLEGTLPSLYYIETRLHYFIVYCGYIIKLLF